MLEIYNPQYPFCKNSILNTDFALSFFFSPLL